MKTARILIAVALSGAVGATQSPQPATPQDCIDAARTFTSKRVKELNPSSPEISRKIMAERLDLIRGCAAPFDVEKADPSDIAGLVDLFAEAQLPQLAERGIERGLAAGLPEAKRAELLASAVRMVLRQPKSDARNARAESYIDQLDALPDSMIDQKLAAHVAMGRYYRADDIDAGIIKHSTWIIDAARGLSSALRLKNSSALVSAYVYQAEALAGQGENDRALAFLTRAPLDLPDVPDVLLRTRDALARYRLVGAPAAPITAASWLNRDAAGPLDLTGAVTLVQFTAHWCGPCKKSYPGMLRLRQRFKGRDFRELFVTRPYGFFETEQNLTPAQEIERDRDYFARYGFDIPVAIGVPDTVMVGGTRTQQDDPNEKAFVVTGIPEIAVVDRKGYVRLIMIGYDDANEPKLGAFIEKLLAEKSRVRNRPHR